jgi:hypothetical protein
VKIERRKWRGQNQEAKSGSKNREVISIEYRGEGREENRGERIEEKGVGEWTIYLEEVILSSVCYYYNHKQTEIVQFHQNKFLLGS